MRWRWLALGVLLLGFGLRVWHLGDESIWHDEGWSIRAIHSPFGTPDDNTPYVYYTTGHLLWRMGAGDSPFALRYVSVLIGLVTVAVALRIGDGWFGRWGGVTTGTLLAISPLLWEYAQEVRAYVAIPLIALLLLASLDAIIRHQPDQTVPRRLWAVVWITEVIGLYTHNLAVPLVAWAGLAASVVWLARHDWRKLSIWFALHISVGVVYIPWLLTQSPSGTTLNTPPEVGFPLVRDIWYSYFLPALPQVQQPEHTLGINLAAIITVLGLLSLSWQRHWRGWLIASQAILVPMFSTALLLAAHIDFHPRYFIAGTPAALLLLIAGVQSFSAKTALSGGIVVLAGIISYNSLHAINTTRTFQHDDFAAVAAYYATLPADAVIIIPFDDEPALEYYFANEYDIQAQFLNIPLHSDTETALRAFRELPDDGPRHVEFLTWFQLPADMRGMYPCFLGGNSSTVGVNRTFFGLSSQAFTLSQEFAPMPLFFDVTFAEGALLNVAYMTSEAGVCVYVDWQPSRNNGETSIVAQILNPIGESIAREDAVIRNAAQESKLTDRGSSFLWLPLPAGTPLDDYPITLTVYNDAMPSGFDAIRDGRIVGKTVQALQPIILRGLPLPDTPLDDQLLADSIGDNPVDSGFSFTVDLLVHQADVVSLVGDGWTLQQPIPSDPNRLARLSWHRFTIPPDADGIAELWVGDTLLKTYTINSVERLLEQPISHETTSVTFEGVGELVGYSVPTPYDVTLIWRATNTTEIPYTVFVQFIAPDGRVIAQSDRQPALDQRPTTSWLPNEYIIDNHRLSLNVDQYSGHGTLVVGFYDPQTFQRVFTTDGQDFYSLPTEYLVD